MTVKFFPLLGWLLCLCLCALWLQSANGSKSMRAGIFIFFITPFICRSIISSFSPNVLVMLSVEGMGSEHLNMIWINDHIPCPLLFHAHFSIQHALYLFIHGINILSSAEDFTFGDL